jgi:hypothetical protein
LTKRGVSEFLVITGTTSSRKLSTDVAGKIGSSSCYPDGNEQDGEMSLYFK